MKLRTTVTAHCRFSARRFATKRRIYAYNKDLNIKYFVFIPFISFISG